MLFSVIVPIYKVEKYLKKCIESVLNQTYTDFELILVDDGSPDNSPKICDEYAEKDNRVHVIHKQNGGVVSARQAGLGIAQGEYIINVDGDDWVTEHLLDELREVIDGYDFPDIIQYEYYRQLSNYQERIQTNLTPGYYSRIKMETDIFPLMIYDRRCPFFLAMISPSIWNKAIKRHLLLEHHCSDTSLQRAEDLACTYECIYFSNNFYYLDKPLYFYNKTNEDSIMTVYDSRYFQNNSKAFDYISAHLGVYSTDLQSQIHAWNVSSICVSVFHEVRHGRNLIEASKHIKKELTTTSCLKNANCKGLPLHAKLFILMLKCKMYFPALLLAKIFIAIKRD